MSYLLVFALSFQCMLDSLEFASRVGIKRDRSVVVWNMPKTKTKQRHWNRLLKLTWNNGNPDSRLFAISWLESRLRPVKRGDRGRACGIFQIHARYSYPLFRRKRGFVGWDEKAEESQPHIQRECNKLIGSTSYSVDTMNSLLKMMDNKDLHPCHHNSGFYGKCNSWYKERLDALVAYFEFSKYMCQTEEVSHGNDQDR